jgi:3-phytase
MHQYFRSLAILLIVTACAQPQVVPTEGRAAPVAVAVVPTLETAPVGTQGDAADDPAIWVHPRDPSQSLVIGTNKQLGLHVYDLDGRLLQTLPDGRLNNVDLRDGFRLGGRSVTIVAASNRTDQSIALYVLDPATRRLARASRPVPTGFAEPYGLCLYASSLTGRHFVFVNDAGNGRVRQWQLADDGGRLAARQVREFVVGSRAEGCAADDEHAALYVAEEDGGFWRYSAEPDGGTRRREIDRVNGTNGLAADIEGVAIWYGQDGRGYVVLSNQGANNYAVYRREGDNAFVGLFRVADNAARSVDGASDTDGLDVTSRPIGPLFPAGLLVVQDGQNLMPAERQNFKYVSWRAVAEALDISVGD